MLQLNKELNRISGGVISTGSIITYKIGTEELTEETTIIFNVFDDAAKVIEGKPIPPIDIEECIKDEKPVNGGKYTPSDDVLNDLPVGAKLVNVTDRVAKKFLEDAFFGPNTITELGATLPG